MTMTLSQCPYDGTPVQAEALSGGSILLSCGACEAAWEYHGAWLGQLRKPDRNKVRAARRRATARDQISIVARVDR